MVKTQELLEYTLPLDVLYVEDDVTVHAQTKMLLESFFNAVDSAYNGEEALSLYKKRKGKLGVYHDIVITDVKMPKMDGISVSKALLQINPDQPIIVISAYNEAQFLYELINLGIAHFINKPINPDQLTSTLFKVAKNLNDRHALQSYYAQIEELNNELMEKNKALEVNNKKLAQSLRVFETKARNIGKCQPRKKPDPQPQKPPTSDEERELGVMISNDLPELSELHEEMDALIVQMMLAEKCDKIIELADLIERFGRVLSGYYSFFTISAAFKDLSEIMRTPPPEAYEHRHNILLMLESFVFTLKRWMEEWSLKRNVTVNFFDDSLISDTKTIINLWDDTPQTGELDDDIFF